MPSLLSRIASWWKPDTDSPIAAKLREQLQRERADNHQLRARIDSAATTDENKRHWAQADSLGPNSALDPATRFRLRNRGRYEALNNSYCRGLVRTLAYDLIGTGPRIQLHLPASAGQDHAEAARAIERNFAAWCRAATIGRKYRLMEKCSARDGEVFGVLETNPRLANPVQLDLKLIEAEQCTTPLPVLNDPFHLDGIHFDEHWNPLEYFFLLFHPGEVNAATLNLPTKFVAVPASRVLHWYEQDRPGQMRGIPKITAGLPLWSQGRRFTLATLTAAEIAAMLAGIMKTNLPPESGVAASVDNWNMVELVRGALLSLPEGWDATQFRPEQPTTTYPEFKRELLNEAGRGVGAPLNVVTGNSSGYNFSSGRLDHLPYHRGLRIDRDEFRDLVTDPLFRAWYEEAVLVPGQVPANLPPIEEWDWEWNYDGFDSIDQNKDATADDTRIKNGTATYAEILAEYGQDWQQVFEQLAREKAYAEKLGLPWPVLSATRVSENISPDSGKTAGGPTPAEDAPPEEDEPPPAPPTRRAPPSRNGHAPRNGQVLGGGR